MAIDDPVLLSPVPGIEDIETQLYTVVSQGLDTRPEVPGTMLGLDLLTFAPYADPRIALPTVVGRIMYSSIITITKIYHPAGQAPWYYGTGTDADGHSHSGWFQKE